MTRRLWSLMGTLMLLAVTDCASAQDLRMTAGQPTRLEDVILSTQSFYPTIRAARARIDETEADLLSASGVFDPRIDGAVSSRLSGFYNSSFGTAGVYRKLPGLSAEFFSEYSVSDGSFPIYEDELITANAGEARLGFAFSLLRDRDIDDERYSVLQAELETDIAGLDLQLERVSVLTEAYVAYVRWLISARLLEAYEELLSVAEGRGEAISRQVNAGDEPEILLIENEQAILQREGLAVDARRQLDLAAESLALFHRSDSGALLYPVYDPALEIPVDDEAFLNSPIPELVDAAVANRPDIAAIEVLQDQIRLDIRLAENLQKPKLDLKFYAGRDFGDGSASLVEPENVVELSFSIPLETRTARGRQASATARLVAVSHELRLLTDSIERDIRSAILNLRATQELKEVATRELEVAQALAEAEARRFEAGTSDFFLLNVRERMLGEAQLRRWQAEFNHQLALAEYFNISMDLPVINEIVD